MKQQGYEDGTDQVCQLQRSVYGLKQALRCWNKRIGNHLVKLGFKVSKADPCHYIRESNGQKLMLVLYVDDGLLTLTDPELLNCFLQELRIEFKIETRSPNYFLGLEIVHTSNGKLIISQKALAKKILERFNFSECRPVSTPVLKTECTGKGKEVVPEEEKTEDEEKKEEKEKKED